MIMSRPGAAMPNVLKPLFFAALPLALCTMVTVLAAGAAFLVAKRIYESERLAVNA